MRKPSRKRVYSPKNERKKTEENKRAREQSPAQGQPRVVINSGVSHDVPTSKDDHRSLHSSEATEHVAIDNGTRNAQQNRKMRNNGKQKPSDDPKHDAFEAVLAREHLIDSLSALIASGGTKADEADNRTELCSAPSTRKSSGSTELPSHSLNSSVRACDVSDIVKEEVTEPMSDNGGSDPHDIAAPEGTVPETEVDASLVVQVAFMLIHSVPLQIEWTAKPHETGISLLMLSKTKPHVVQREIDVHVTGTVKIFVHRLPLKEDHELWKAIPPPVALTEFSVEPFIHYLRALCYTMRQYPICSGVSNEQYKDFWLEMPQATFEDNFFQETRYTQTCRSKTCDMVVTQRELRCLSCRHLYNVLRIKKRKLPFRFTPGGLDAYKMTKDEMIEQAKLLQRENFHLREKIQRLQGQQSCDVSLNRSFNQELSDTNLTPVQKLLTPSAQSTEPSQSGDTLAKQDRRIINAGETTPLTAVVTKLKQRLQTISHGKSSSTPPLSV